MQNFKIWLNISWEDFLLFHFRNKITCYSVYIQLSISWYWKQHIINIYYHYIYTWVSMLWYSWCIDLYQSISIAKLTMATSKGKTASLLFKKEKNSNLNGLVKMFATFSLGMNMNELDPLRCIIPQTKCTSVEIHLTSWSKIWSQGYSAKIMYPTCKTSTNW